MFGVLASNPKTLVAAVAVAVCLCLRATAGEWTILEPPNPQAGAAFGFRAISPVEDLTADGVPDILVGAYRHNAGAFSSGQVSLLDGKSGELVQTLVSPAPEFEGFFGHDVLGFPDITGDGLPEIVIGASPESAGARGSGRVYVIDGATFEVVRTIVSPNPSLFVQFGVELAAIPDVNGDGIPELAVGAYRETVNNGFEAGRAYVFDGATGAHLRTLHAPSPSQGAIFGNWLAGLPDLNGNGSGEVVITAPGETSGCAEGAGRAYIFDGGT